jgi:hypothetical protein
MVTHRLLPFLVLLFGCSILVGAQAEPKKPTKPKPIRATVTVKGSGNYVAPKLPDERKWTEFELTDHGLSILFPGDSDDIFDDGVGPVQTFSVSTENATYMLAIRSVGLPIDVRDTQTYLDETIDNAFDPETTKYVFRRSISYEGRIGRELALIDNDKRTEFRVYLINDKIFIVSVAVRQQEYSAGFDKWIKKFFDSFRVRVQIDEA